MALSLMLLTCSFKLDYGNLQEISAKLKEQVRSIKLKATRDSACIMELYHQVQVISAKIKASGSLSLLENDEEYVALVGKHLTKEVMWRWFEQACHTLE